jgi:hypothetical protein
LDFVAIGSYFQQLSLAYPRSMELTPQPAKPFLTRFATRRHPDPSLPGRYDTAAQLNIVNEGHCEKPLVLTAQAPEMETRTTGGETDGD